MENDTLLSLQNINKYFGTNHILQNVYLSVAKSQVVSIIGPSGAGKSTLLRCINYLEHPDSGTYLFDGHRFDAAHMSNNDIDFLRLHTGMVFQQFNLFSEMTVLENIVFGLIKVKHMKKEEATEIAHRLLRKVDMEERCKFYPAQLSGGQKQRAAIARAVALSPQVLLFDEPTSALDIEMIGKVLQVIRTLAEEGQTMVIVSHEMNFVKTISDKVVFMADGMVIEEGTPEEIFDHPKELRTKQFFETISLAQ
ncbi:putative L-cystine ABC transporter, ATP-binding protein TcyN [Acidaminococcus sp. BV3L6]|nr:amino acid ABC transporter ATP-binding protein [Acidaminococcus sp. BV3L6]ERL20031.1 putative L-cystine ABC transporter, ATP-binding protein TcyN [Acidaminococcus sp. BV3L6]